MKRLIPLLALAVVVCLFAVPDASASCWRCSAGLQACVYVNHPAYTSCTWIPAEHWCDLGEDCEPFGITDAAPLASEYEVESVEVIDETAEQPELEQKIAEHID